MVDKQMRAMKRREPMSSSSTEQTTQPCPAVVAEVHAYIAWLEEREAVRDAYKRWTSGSSWGAALAFGAYRDALDREEEASCVYETVLREVSTGAFDAGRFDTEGPDSWLA
jgi:hypothetical protein